MALKKKSFEKLESRKCCVPLFSFSPYNIFKSLLQFCYTPHLQNRGEDAGFTMFICLPICQSVHPSIQVFCFSAQKCLTWDCETLHKCFPLPKEVPNCLGHLA